ncbi:MAG: Ig-like domain-containing protein, partial [Erysipelotrichaceae bacterium]|nr:Ig-like domain-containing protein [Erysipelotrichaceae bacterium]
MKRRLMIGIPLVALILTGCRSDEIEPTSIAITNHETSLIVEETLQLTTTVLPLNHKNVTVLFDSSNDEVATVSTSGLVTAVAVGEVEITASVSGYTNLSADISLEIKPKQGEQPPEIDLVELWENALETDFSNVTMDVVSIYDYMAGEEYYVLKNIDGYTVASHPESGLDPLYYHDYEGESHLYFEDEYGYGDAWLKEGYKNSPLGLENTYFSVDVAIDELSAVALDAIEVDDSGSIIEYFIRDEATLTTLNAGMLSSFWNNGLFWGVLISVDPVTSNIVRIMAFDETSADDGMFVVFSMFGTSTHNLPFPPKPNADNVMTYAEWSGTDPWINVDVEGVSIALPEDEDGILDREERVRMVVTYDPVDANNSLQMMLDWYSSDEAVVTVSVIGEVTAVNEGTATVWCETYNGHKSNEVTITVRAIPTPVLEGIVHDLTFNGVTNDVVSYDDAVTDAHPLTITTARVTSNDAANGGTDKFPHGKQALLMDPQGASYIDINADDELLTGISFNFSLFWPADISNLSKLSQFEIQTSEDGTTWTMAADLMTLVQENISRNSITLVEVEFEATSHVRVYAYMNFIGSPFRLATDNIKLYYTAPAEVPVTSVTLSAVGATELEIGATGSVTASVLPE